MTKLLHNLTRGVMGQSTLHPVATFLGQLQEVDSYPRTLFIMISINLSLPIELLDMIFQYATTDGTMYHFPGPVLQLPDIPDRHLFPLNVAGVCTLWLQILKSHPRLWQLVVINVASNPAPFLDTLDLFTAEPGRAGTLDFFMANLKPDTLLNLIVFSSDPSIDKHLENSRTRLVFEHLEPVIHRYARIIFRLVYQSSLPSPADILFPHPSQNLRELILTCTTYDLSDNDADDSGVIGDGYDTPFLGPTIPTNLRKLSLTGVDFMHLCLTGWLQIKRQYHFELSISHYQFRRRRDFTVLMDFLRNIAHSNTKMYILLCDISLAYRPSQEDISKCTLQIQKMSFSNVSADFISAFFSAITFADRSLRFACFENCVIPRIGRWNQNIPVIEPSSLELVDIDSDDSVYNATEAFPATDVRIIRCKGVTDRFLSRLSGDDCTGIEANKMGTLTLVDCTDFTVEGACALLVNRHRRTQNKTERWTCRTLGGFYVIGKGPAFHEDDVEILEEHTSHASVLHKASVSWNVERSTSHAPGWVTDLRPLSPGRETYLRREWGVRHGEP